MGKERERETILLFGQSVTCEEEMQKNAEVMNCIKAHTSCAYKFCSEKSLSAPRPPTLHGSTFREEEKKK